MKEVYLRGLVLGRGRPQICVSLQGKTACELRAELEAARRAGANVAEWRADAFENAANLLPTAQLLRKSAGDFPLLFTYRSKAEGGQGCMEAKQLVELASCMAQQGGMDAVDVELALGESAVRTVVDTARQNGVLAVVSCHNFRCTPPKEEMLATLHRMRALGADVPKLAVMPQNFADVLALMEAVNAYTQTTKSPAIAMAMGEMGRISRVAGQFYGSVLTFGSLGRPSAPGQLPVARLAAVLDSMA